MSRIVEIRYSKDGGRNWSDWIERSLGERGDFMLPVTVMRCGRGTHFVFDIRTTDSVRADILASAAMIEPTQV